VDEVCQADYSSNAKCGPLQAWTVWVTDREFNLSKSTGNYTYHKV
jgi:hypothetical protein